MAKIFLSFYNGISSEDNNEAIPLFYEAFCKGLKQFGNDVLAITHKKWIKEWGVIPDLLLEEIKSFNPDIIILFNNAFFNLSQYFDCPIIVYEVDSPLYYQNREELKNNSFRYIFFVLQETSVSDLQQSFHIPVKNIHILPFFTSIIANKKDLKRNICFIGSKFTDQNKNCINCFMEAKPSDVECQIYFDLLKKVQRNPFMSQAEFLQNDISDKIKSYFNKDELIFILSDYLRTQVLNNVADLGLEIWGNSRWGEDNYGLPYMNLSYNCTPAYSIQHNQDIYNSSKIGISIAHLQAKEGFPWRILDVMASNACLVTDYHANLKKYFPDVSLPCYETPYEARELCLKLLKDEAYRQDIVLQSQEIVNKNYRFINTLKLMQEYLNINLINEIPGTLRLLNLAIYDSKEKPINHIKIKDNLYYKLWAYLDKKLRKKGLIQ